MPKFLEPDQRFPIVLEGDKDKANPPTFFAKSQSMRGQMQLNAKFDELIDHNKHQSTEELFAEVVATLATVVIGWQNMGDIPFSVDAFYDVLDSTEAFELLRKVQYNQHVDLEAKKN